MGRPKAKHVGKGPNILLMPHGERRDKMIQSIISNKCLWAVGTPVFKDETRRYFAIQGIAVEIKRPISFVKSAITRVIYTYRRELVKYWEYEKGLVNLKEPYSTTWRAFHQFDPHFRPYWSRSLFKEVWAVPGYEHLVPSSFEDEKKLGEDDLRNEQDVGVGKTKEPIGAGLEEDSNESTGKNAEDDVEEDVEEEDAEEDAEEDVEEDVEEETFSDGNPEGNKNDSKSCKTYQGNRSNYKSKPPPASNSNKKRRAENNMSETATKSKNPKTTVDWDTSEPTEADRVFIKHLVKMMHLVRPSRRKLEMQMKLQQTVMNFMEV